MRQQKDHTYKIAVTGLLAALSYAVFTYGQIRIMLPGGDATSIHLGNAVCVLGALLAGGFAGGLGGAIGMTIGDLLDPVYVGLRAEDVSLQASDRPDCRICRAPGWGISNTAASGGRSCAGPSWPRRQGLRST